jgi:hypothetical protein
MSYSAWDRTFLFSKFDEPAFDLKFHFVEGLYVYHIYNDNYDTIEDRRAFLARSNVTENYDGTGQFQLDDTHIHSAGADIKSAALIFLLRQRHSIQPLHQLFLLRSLLPQCGLRLSDFWPLQQGNFMSSLATWVGMKWSWLFDVVTSPVTRCFPIT